MICVDWPCDSCKYVHKKLLDGWNVACDAFPEGMPTGWLKVDVTVLEECANGYRYEPKKKLTNQKRAG